MKCDRCAIWFQCCKEFCRKSSKWWGCIWGTLRLSQMQRSQMKLPEGELVWGSSAIQEQCQLCLYAAPGIATPDGCSCCGAGANVTNDGTAQNSRRMRFRLQQCGVFFTDVENKQQIQPKDSEVENSLFSLVLLWNVKANFWSCISEGRRGKLKEGNVCCQQWAWGKASWFGLQLSSLLESCEIAVHAAWACCNTGKMNVLVICKQMHINFYLCISPVLCIVYLHTEIC